MIFLRFWRVNFCDALLLILNAKRNVKNAIFAAGYKDSEHWKIRVYY